MGPQGQVLSGEAYEPRNGSEPTPTWKRVDITGVYSDRARNESVQVTQTGQKVEFMYQGRQMAGTIRAPLKGPIVSTALLHVDDMRWKNGYILLNGDISFADGGEWKKRVRRSSDNIASPTSTPIKK